MTEEQWLTASSPLPMLMQVRLLAGDRKRRLFACACARRVGDLFADAASERAVRTAERYADGLAGKKALHAALAEARAAVRQAHTLDARQGNAAACAATAATEANLEIARQAAWLAAHARAPAPSAMRAELQAQADLVRDLFGNPFRQPVVVDTAWLEWDGGAVRRLAQAVYTEQAFDLLPVLADALEDAGCAGPVLLDHLRRPGAHALGCWALDRLLGNDEPQRIAGNAR